MHPARRSPRYWTSPHRGVFHELNGLEYIAQVVVHILLIVLIQQAELDSFGGVVLGFLVGVCVHQLVVVGDLLNLLEFGSFDVLYEFIGRRD